MENSTKTAIKPKRPPERLAINQQEKALILRLRQLQAKARSSPCIMLTIELNRKEQSMRLWSGARGERIG